jgi:hypothetical protein
MSFDVAIGMNQTTLTDVAAALYKRPGIKSKVFSGSQPIDEMGVKSTVSYELLAPPIVKLQAPTPDQWKRAIKADGTAPQPVQNAMIVTLPNLRLTRPDQKGQLHSGTVALDAIATIGIANDTLQYTALGVIVDLSHATPFDQVIYKKIVIPHALKAVGEAFGHPHIPNITFKGVKFGPVVLVVGGGMMVVVANLAGKSPPTPPPPQTSALPNEPIFILLSHEAMQKACEAGTGDLVGKSAGKSGSASFGVGNASYDGSVRIDSISVQVGNDPTQVNAQIAVAASASAGISVLDTIIGGVKTAANTVAGGVTTAANTVAGGVTTAANTVAGGVKTAANAVANAFHGY